MFGQINRLLNLFGLVAPHRTEQPICKNDQIDQQHPAVIKLSVADIKLVFDDNLPDSAPCCLVRKANQAEVQVAELRLTRAFKEKIGQSQEAKSKLEDLFQIGELIFKRADLVDLCISIDDSLPYSQPYKTIVEIADPVKAPDQLSAHISVNRDLPRFLVESQLRSDSNAGDVMYRLGMDVSSLKRRPVLREALVDEFLSLVSSDPNIKPYLVPVSLKRVVDPLLRGISQFEVQDSSLGRPAKMLLVDLILKEQEINRSEEHIDISNLSEAAEEMQQAKRFFGKDAVEELISAISALNGEIEGICQYIQDSPEINGYGYVRHEDRLAHVFSNHPLNLYIDKLNKQTPPEGSYQDTFPRTVYELAFRLKGNDLEAPETAELKFADPERISNRSSDTNI